MLEGIEGEAISLQKLGIPLLDLIVGVFHVVAGERQHNLSHTGYF